MEFIEKYIEYSIQPIITLLIVITIIRANINNRKEELLHGKLIAIKVLVIVGVLMCFSVEYGLHVVFIEKLFYTYMYTMIGLFSSHIFFIIFQFLNKKTAQLFTLPFLMGLFIMSIITAVYFLFSIELIIVPLFGFLLIIPFLYTLILGGELKGYIKNVKVPFNLSFTSKFVLALISGMIILFIIQLSLNVLIEEQWVLIKVFFNNGKFGVDL